MTFLSLPQFQWAKSETRHLFDRFLQKSVALWAYQDKTQARIANRLELSGRPLPDCCLIQYQCKSRESLKLLRLPYGFLCLIILRIQPEAASPA